MRFAFLAACALTGLALTACDKPKERVVSEAPPPPSASPTATAAAGDAMSASLPVRPEFPGFYLDHIGSALDPLNKAATVDGGVPLLFDGFGFDPVTKAPAEGVDLEIDGKLYGTVYGAPRQDVAEFNHAPALTPVGFKTVLPPNTLASGAHQVRVRVISSDGAAYYQAPVISFNVR